MDDSTLYREFYLWLGVAAGLIVVAAILLILVWTAARRILRLATAALTLVIQIKENTASIWGLEQTNETAVRILDGAKAIERHAGLVAEALQEQELSN